MKVYYEPAAGEEGCDLYREAAALIRRGGWTWQAVCAVAGLAGGLLAPLFGAAFNVTSWFAHSQAVVSRLHVLSIVSCTLTLPLLALGGYCLDLLEKRVAR